VGRGVGGRTLMVNLLYGNRLGMRLKKCSSYSSSLMARMAREDSCGLRDGGNLPFWSHFSVWVGGSEDEVWGKGGGTNRLR
jgi:hypothetical protein